MAAVVNFATLVTSDNNGILEAGETELLLVPGDYQLCEFIAPGWDSTIAGLPGAFVPGSRRSTDRRQRATSAPRSPSIAGETEIFTIDNTPPPGGMAKTIGFWKNHTSCDGKGNQEALPGSGPDRRWFAPDRRPGGHSLRIRTRARSSWISSTSGTTRSRARSRMARSWPAIRHSTSRRSTLPIC